MKVRTIAIILMFAFLLSCVGGPIREYTHIVIGKDTSISSLNHHKEDVDTYGIAAGIEKKFGERFHYGIEISGKNMKGKETNTELNTANLSVTGSYDIYKGERNRLTTTLIGGLGISTSDGFSVLQEKKNGYVKKDSDGLTGRICLRLKYEYMLREGGNIFEDVSAYVLIQEDHTSRPFSHDPGANNDEIGAGISGYFNFEKLFEKLFWWLF